MHSKMWNDRSPIFANVAVILQSAADRSIVNNTASTGVTGLDLQDPPEMTIWLKAVAF